MIPTAEFRLNGLDFKAARSWLQWHFPSAIPWPSPALSVANRLQLPTADPTQWGQVQHYLVDERGLPAELLQPLLNSGRIYADHRGNAVFLLLGKENSPVGAELRGTSGTSWRGLASGSRKDLGYFSVSAPHRTGVVLCESAIDALSCCAIYPGLLCISTSGARANPAWLPALLRQDHPLYCGFDTDSTGEQMAQNMIALYPAVKRLRPLQHDWNDTLRSSRHGQPLAR